MKKYLLFSVLTSIFFSLSPAYTREFLDANIHHATGDHFEIYPVKVSKNAHKSSSKECFEYGKECLLPLTKDPALVVKDFDFQKVVGERAGIKFFLNEKDAKALTLLTQKYFNTRLAIVHNNKVITAPKIKSILSDQNFEITFKSKAGFEKVLKQLQHF
ncbi:MAG: hypothetical protein HQK50_08035 [Oligoflexia bacterium]|nr:hypothetical protein [Oligoflexia bacterium]MBF0365506.1 hypothetical protein [Oligoflexia bacterium]